MTSYTDFLASKNRAFAGNGIDVPLEALHSSLFSFQRQLTRWALRKGRAALFADTGLGKSYMLLAWAQQLPGRVLILAPLAVAQQTVAIAKGMGIDLLYARSEEQAGDHPLVITNYEMLKHFKPENYIGVVLDESSCLKFYASKTTNELIEAFSETKYRLCCTATPAPNDVQEFANHAEFLGIMTRAEMLASFFIHDECFAEDTEIDTPAGKRNIGDIEVGDEVLNAYGVDRVVGTSTRDVSRLIAVSFGNQRVFCSENHPWLTVNGWVPAHALREGDYLVTCSEAMRSLWNPFYHDVSAEQPQGAFLREILLSEMAYESTGTPSQSVHTRDGAEVISSDNGLFCIGYYSSRTPSGAGAAIQAIYTGRSSPANQRVDAAAGYPPDADSRAITGMGPWDSVRQWNRANSRTGTALRSARRWLGDRGNRRMGIPDSRISQLLSCGSSKSGADDSCGGRWEVASSTATERERQKERGIPEAVRVDGVTIHQRGDSAFDRYSGGKDSVTLYDLKVKHHPSFSVHGVLVHNSGWRLKGHARTPFYAWLASWGMSVGKPSDLGFEDTGYILPELHVEPIIVAADYVPEGQLFATGLKGVSDRSKVRRGTMEERVYKAAELIASEPDQQWIAWSGLNEESKLLTDILNSDLFNLNAVEVEGKQSPDEKTTRILDFTRGKYNVLVSKAEIAGFGLNLQNAARQVFVGLSDSWEKWYQAIRRSWRFGQKQPVHVYAIVSDLEVPIYENVQRKEREAHRHRVELIANVAAYEREEITSVKQEDPYREDEASGHGWTLKLGDSTTRLTEIPDASIDLSVYSPPFSSLYVYSNSTRDLGNAADREEFFQHYRFIIREMLRVTKPGRNTVVHVQQIASTLAHDGVIGLTDFRGDVIRAYQAEGWIYHGEVCVDKDPQAQAIRTHSKSLLFVQLRRDASWMRPALADYILVFRKPGENQEPVKPDITNEDWIEWARPIWYGIRESDTLNTAIAKENDDERHIAPLQLGTIERCIRLWSNPGELVLSPFAGIGSEGVTALRTGRRFVGIELKESYWRTAKRNLEREQLQGQMDLFGATEAANA